MKRYFHNLQVMILAASLWLASVSAALGAPRPPLPQEAPEIAEATHVLYRGDYQRAFALASEYLGSHPDSLSGRILVARAEIAEGKYTAAYDRLRKTLELDPTDIDALYYLNRLCTILSQIELRRLIETSPASYRAHQVMAESYLAQHNEAEAEAEYGSALEANPKSVEILDGLGDLKRSQFKFNEALAYYRRALEVAPRDYTSAYGVGACYLFEQDLRGAIGSFRRALEIDPRSPAAHLALGDALLRAGQAAPAVTELKAAAALSPGMRQVYTLLARGYQKLGRTEKARHALQREQELEQEEIRSRGTIPSSEERLPGRPENPLPAGSRAPKH